MPPVLGPVKVTPRDFHFYALPSGHNQANALGRDAADYKPENSRCRPVDPLPIIDRQKQRPLCGE